MNFTKAVERMTKGQRMTRSCWPLLAYCIVKKCYPEDFYPENTFSGIPQAEMKIMKSTGTDETAKVFEPPLVDMLAEDWVLFEGPETFSFETALHHVRMGVAVSRVAWEGRRVWFTDEDGTHMDHRPEFFKEQKVHNLSLCSVDLNAHDWIEVRMMPDLL